MIQKNKPKIKKIDVFKMSKFIFLITFVISQLFSNIVTAQCNVVINEVNAKQPGKNDFIELKTDCIGKTLRGYKVIGIEVKKEGSAAITKTATLWNEKFCEDFYTIGGTNIEKSDMKITSDYIRFRNSWNDKKLSSITNFLENENTNLYAIGILYKYNDPMSSIQLNKKNTIFIDENLKEFLVNNLIDLVVYSEKCDRDRCKIFEDFHSGFTNKKYTLREFKFKSTDISLNRCTVETDGFIPEKFKIGKPTPGLENDCSGTNNMPKDIFRENIDVLYNVDDYVKECKIKLQTVYKQTTELIDKMKLRNKSQYDKNLNVSNFKIGDKVNTFSMVHLLLKLMNIQTQL